MSAELMNWNLVPHGFCCYFTTQNSIFSGLSINIESLCLIDSFFSPSLLLFVCLISPSHKHAPKYTLSNSTLIRISSVCVCQSSSSSAATTAAVAAAANTFRRRICVCKSVHTSSWSYSSVSFSLQLLFSVQMQRILYKFR